MKHVLPKLRIVAAALVLLLAAAAHPAAASDTLRLRVNDAIGEPGGLVALVVRTYASRPISQGQICFRSVARATDGASLEGARPFASLEGFKVFSKAKDALGDAELMVQGGGQMVLLQFSSVSGSINRVDGPLAVIYFRLKDTLDPGQRFDLRVDVADSVLVDAEGNTLPLENRGGQLLVRHPAARLLVEADGDKIEPGEIAELGVETREPFAIASGQVGFRYDPAIAAGSPRVRMDRRFGRRRFSVDRSEPGLVLVTFRSHNASLNMVPGELVSIDVPTDPAARRGTSSRVWLDPSLTFLVDPEGDLLPIRLKRERVRFE